MIKTMPAIKQDAVRPMAQRCQCSCTCVCGEQEKSSLTSNKSSNTNEAMRTI